MSTPVKYQQINPIVMLLAQRSITGFTTATQSRNIYASNSTKRATKIEKKGVIVAKKLNLDLKSYDENNI